MPNRLTQEKSAYLLQHQHNPVDWYPWGEEAFKRAKAEDKPVFLSVGYSSCHWCHVMEHECFEDEEIAKLLNERFISVKVDREERPDVDDVYMTAVQLTAGRGGWPMSVFMTPEKKPFFAGTYFPKHDRGQSPGFLTVLMQLDQLWLRGRGEVESAADEVAKAVASTLAANAIKGSARLDRKLFEGAIAKLSEQFDDEFGGFGGAPKFPPHGALEFFFGYAFSSGADEEAARNALGMAAETMAAMALGGICDHVGGGFHRYAIDREWFLPHFEKMLYDNALLLGVYSLAAPLLAETSPELSGLFHRTAAGIMRWLKEEMRGENGLYYSGLDADSEGREGKFYLWTEAEIRDLLAVRADAFIEAYQVENGGNFQEEATGNRTGENILAPVGYNPEFDQDLDVLRRARALRSRPGLDDKQIICHNALLATALCMATQEEAAEEIVRAILAAETRNGGLPHMIVKGQPSGQAFLDDYAATARACLELCAISHLMEKDDEADVWMGHAERLVKEMVDGFYDQAEGGFFLTSARHESLLGRAKPAFDNPVPSGNGLAIEALLGVGRTELAERCLKLFAGLMEGAPEATGSLLHAAVTLTDTLAESESWEQQGLEFEARSSPEEAMEPEVHVRLIPSELVADEKGVARGKVSLEIPAGFHINGPKPPANWLVPTAVAIEPLLADVSYPADSGDRYLGRVDIPFAVTLPKGEKGADFEVTITYQACNESACLLPSEKRLSGVVLQGGR